MKVSSLSREDLICTKFKALCDRDLETDFEDMVGMNPKGFELEKAKEWILASNPEMKSVVEESIVELNRELGRSFGRGR